MSNPDGAGLISRLLIVDGQFAVDAGWVANAPEVRLFTAGPADPSIDDVIGDYTECGFDGYAAAVPFVTIGNDGGGRPVMTIWNVTFTAGGALVGPFESIVYVGLVFTAGSARLQAVAKLSTPVLVHHVGQMMIPILEIQGFDGSVKLDM